MNEKEKTDNFIKIVNDMALFLEEVKFDLENMRIQRVETKPLSEEELIYKTNELQAKLLNIHASKEELYNESYMSNYYFNWRMKLLLLIDYETLGKIYENGCSNSEIANELGITEEELCKPNLEVYTKAEQYVMEHKDSMTR